MLVYHFIMAVSSFRPFSPTLTQRVEKPGSSPLDFTFLKHYFPYLRNICMVFYKRKQKRIFFIFLLFSSHLYKIKAGWFAILS